MKIKNLQFFLLSSLLGILFAFQGCAPKEPVVFKGVKNIVVDMGSDGKPVLKGDVYFFNPNKIKMKLKEVDVDVAVDGSKSAEVRQKLDLDIPGQSDFSVPLTAQLTLKEGGLLGTVLSLLGGKKFEVVFTGKIKIGVHGITIKVPVQQSQEIKLR